MGGGAPTTPNQLRWLPPEVATANHTFVEGITTLAGAGEPSLRCGPPLFRLISCSEQGGMTGGGCGCAHRAGIGMHMYTATAGMGDSCLVNSDGDLLLVPQASPPPRAQTPTQTSPCAGLAVIYSLSFSAFLLCSALLASDW